MSMTDEDAVIARRAARLGDLLAQADVATRPIAYPEDRVRTALRRRARWRVAAVLVLLAAGAAGVSPARAWIVGAARALLAHVVRAPAPARAPTQPPGTAAGAVTSSVGDVFTLRLVSRQAGGSVGFVAEDRQTVTARVLAAPGQSGGEITVLQDGIRIANDPASTADYEMRIPARLTRVVVIVAGEAPRAWHPSAPGDHWRLPLVRNGRPGSLKN